MVSETSRAVVGVSRKWWLSARRGLAHRRNVSHIPSEETPGVAHLARTKLSPCLKKVVSLEKAVGQTETIDKINS
jgi:hypothetical protein